MRINCITYCLFIDKDDPARLHQIAADRGWTVVAAYQDDPLTASNQRPGYKALLRSLTKGGLGALVVPSLLALGSTLDEAVALLAKLKAADVHLVVFEDGIDTRTPEGAAWLVAVASLAGFHQAIRKQKARAGQRRAQDAGVKFGRPPIESDTLNKLRNALRDDTSSVRSLARRLGISPSRVQMEKNAMLAEHRG